MEDRKKVGLHSIFSDLKSGLNQKQISEKRNMPKQNVSYYVDKLKKMGCVEKIGHGVSSKWKILKEVQNRPKDTSKVKVGLREIRGHAFIWNVEFLEGGFDWNQVVKNYKKRYKKPSLSFKIICGGKVPRTIFKNRKIWMTKAGLTIYEPLNFFGKSAFSVKGTAVYELDKLVKDFLKKFKLTFQTYRFKCSREHYAHVNNQIARQFNDRKQKIKVGHDGKWFWIDFSDGINEEEAGDPQTSRGAQNMYKSQMKTGWKVTPEFILNGMAEQNKAIKKNAEHLEFHAENMRSHVGAIRKLGKGINKQNELFEKLANLIESKM